MISGLAVFCFKLVLLSNATIFFYVSLPPFEGGSQEWTHASIVPTFPNRLLVQ